MEVRTGGRRIAMRVGVSAGLSLLVSTASLIAPVDVGDRAIAAVPADIVGPPGSGAFGADVVVLDNGNLVVTDPSFDTEQTADVGAVHLYDGRTRHLISTLTGSGPFDLFGPRIVEVGTSDFVVASPFWHDPMIGADVGAITWVDGTTGLNGSVSTSNSATGSYAGNQLSSVQVLSDGDYVILDKTWKLGLDSDVGAVRWASGSTGATGPLTPANSLVGSMAGNEVGGGGIIALTNGNYVALSPNWERFSNTLNIGAATWQSGAGSVGAAVALGNSLIGGTDNDHVGTSSAALTNGNYVIGSPEWTSSSLVHIGAATWGDGAVGISGFVSPLNSLVGVTGGDRAGASITPLSNGNYVVGSPDWRNDTALAAGAATWRPGAQAAGNVAISPANSIVGTTTSERLGQIIAPLVNGNYVVASPRWSVGGEANVGAVRWASGMGQSVGPISTGNSVHGSKPEDRVGALVEPLSDGNYVIGSNEWANDAVPADIAGAATWASGSGLTSLEVSPANSIVGTHRDDRVGITVRALANGNYLVAAPRWDNSVKDVGAVRFGLAGGTTVGPISATNSLVGSIIGESVGLFAIVPAPNGTAVVASPWFAKAGEPLAGAVTVVGPAGPVGEVSITNSLTGGGGDGMGGRVVMLPDGRFAVLASGRDNLLATDVGAVTLSDPAGGPMVLDPTNTVLASEPNRGLHLAIADQYTAEGAFAVGRSGDNRVSLLVPASPPTVAPVPDVTAVAPPRASSVPVTYTVPNATDNSGPVPVDCLPPSGSSFAIGTTTVTCTATDIDGLVGTTSFTVTVTPAARTDFVPLPPARLADTRPMPHTTVDGRFANGGIAAPGSTLAVTVVGRGGVAADAAAVALNVTATESQGAGFVTVFPCGAPRPTASNLNHVLGSTIPNAVVAKVGDGGAVCIFNQTATHLVVDVGGYFPASTTYEPINPVRLLDSRPGLPTSDGQQQGGGLRAAQAVTEVDVGGRLGIPADASSVVLNVTVTEPALAGFITVFPCGDARPLASSLNAESGATVANLVVAKIGAGGKVCLFNQSATHLVVDANGYFPATTSFHSINPARLLDSRAEATTVDGAGAGGGSVPLGTVTTVMVGGRAGVPLGASTVVLNVTVTETQSPGFVTVYPCGIDPPLASNLNYSVDTTAPNAVIVKIGPSETVCLFNSQALHLVVDVAGYF